MGCPKNSFPIFTGDAKVMPLRVAYASGLPLDLTDCTEIVANLINADGSTTQLKLSLTEIEIVDPPVLGQFNVTISAVASAKLQVGELQNVDVTFTIATKPSTVRFYQALSVFQSA